jgi:hypothetical protein
MSITPPPSYPIAQTDVPAHLKQSSVKAPLDTVSTDLSNALQTAKAEAVGVPKPKKHTIEQPALVNVFVRQCERRASSDRELTLLLDCDQNYTGAVFGEDEEYEHSDFLVSTSRGLGRNSAMHYQLNKSYHSRPSQRLAILPWKSYRLSIAHHLPTPRKPDSSRKSKLKEERSNTSILLSVLSLMGLA